MTGNAGGGLKTLTTNEFFSIFVVAIELCGTKKTRAKMCAVELGGLCPMNAISPSCAGPEKAPGR